MLPFRQTKQQSSSSGVIASTSRAENKSSPTRGGALPYTNMDRTPSNSADSERKPHICWYSGLGGSEHVHSVEKSFASSTSCHGLARINESCHPTRKLVWTSLVAIGLACIVWQVSLLVQNYLSWPTNTSLSKKYGTDMPFPAVTICNYNRYIKSTLSPCEQEIIDALAHAYRENTTEATDHFQTVISRCNDGHFDLDEFNKAKGWKLDDKTLLSCSFKGKPCKQKDWTQVSTRLGNCYTFNGAGSISQTQPGSASGLYLEIDVASDQYTYLLDEYTHTGLKYLIHSPSEPPFVMVEGDDVSSGFEVSTSVRRRQHSNLVAPWGECRNDIKLENFDSYTVPACVLECQSRYVTQRCGCNPSYLPGKGKKCDVTEMICARLVHAEVNSNLPQFCDCPIACDYNQHDVRLSYARYPTEKHAQTLAEKAKLDAAYIKSNVAALRIFFEELSYEKIEQQVAVTFGDLLGDIGGQMGLFLGISLMTTLEFLEYFINIIFRIINRNQQFKQD
ncbi:bile acid-sensitive ion channel-like [Tubulanus polymorphus]|uniref:bile acid-sensitive ion channel-like n=1 Tax=Tubulanus polymorphus TaxID=672921 RepID=UPI003DA21D37